MEQSAGGLASKQKQNRQTEQSFGTNFLSIFLCVLKHAHGGLSQTSMKRTSFQSACKVDCGFWTRGRANPQLKVTRYQFPIAPDFADTFYGAQGSTIEPGVIVDMIGADPIAAYIGMTRCRTRQKILIYRPFPLAPFQEGLPLGRQLLLDVWKQERGLGRVAQEVLG